MIQGFIFHPRHESRRDITHNTVSGARDANSEIEAGCSCTKRQSEDITSGGK
jgi:hypothetical protein